MNEVVSLWSEFLAASAVFLPGFLVIFGIVAGVPLVICVITGIRKRLSKSQKEELPQ